MFIFPYISFKIFGLLSKQSPLGAQHVTMDSHRNLSFQIPNDHHTVFRWYTQQHVDVICHCFALFQPYAFLTAQIPKDFPDSAPHLLIEGFSVIFWQDHNMILTFPFHLCLTFVIFHYGPPCPQEPSSWRTVLHYHARNGIAFSILTGRAGGLTVIDLACKSYKCKATNIAIYP